MLSEPIEVTLVVTRVLDELGIDYLVGGSVASSLHGINGRLSARPGVARLPRGA